MTGRWMQGFVHENYLPTATPISYISVLALTQHGSTNDACTHMLAGPFSGPLFSLEQRESHPCPRLAQLASFGAAGGSFPSAARQLQQTAATDMGGPQPGRRETDKKDVAGDQAQAEQQGDGQVAMEIGEQSVAKEQPEEEADGKLPRGPQCPAPLPALPANIQQQRALKGCPLVVKNAVQQGGSWEFSEQPGVCSTAFIVNNKKVWLPDLLAPMLWMCPQHALFSSLTNQKSCENGLPLGLALGIPLSATLSMVVDLICLISDNSICVLSVYLLDYVAGVSQAAVAANLAQHMVLVFPAPLGSTQF
eukprot:scaffold126778_cov18-Tisochrysis_lutea.AAC.1